MEELIQEALDEAYQYIVKKINAYQLMENEQPSILSAQIAIRDVLNDNQPVPVTIDRIIGEVARTFGVSPEDIRSQKRSAAISSARQVAVYIVRDITQISMTLIKKSAQFFLHVWVPMPKPGARQHGKIWADYLGKSF